MKAYPDSDLVSLATGLQISAEALEVAQAEIERLNALHACSLCDEELDEAEAALAKEQRAHADTKEDLKVAQEQWQLFGETTDQLNNALEAEQQARQKAEAELANAKTSISDANETIERHLVYVAETAKRERTDAKRTVGMDELLTMASPTFDEWCEHMEGDFSQAIVDAACKLLEDEDCPECGGFGKYEIDTGHGNRKLVDCETCKLLEDSDDD